MCDDMIYYIWLALSLPYGSPVIKKILNKISSPQELYLATEEELFAFEELSEEHVAHLNNKSLEQAENIIAFCEKKQVAILTIKDEFYPKRLREIDNPPAVLYAFGKYRELNKHLAFAVVGSRSFDFYGQEQAFTLGYEIALTGGAVVSGLALGIDGIAHAGALAANGLTIAVLGCGMDQAYPPRHRKLLSVIAKKGIILTEFPPGSPPSGFHFPIRNRIISGLSESVTMVTGNLKSGALITANLAHKQGRGVFAVPACVDNEKYEGCLFLLKEKAKICTSTDDVLDEYIRETVKRLNTFALLKAKVPEALPILRSLEVHHISHLQREDYFHSYTHSVPGDAYAQGMRVASADGVKDEKTTWKKSPENLIKPEKNNKGEKTNKKEKPEKKDKNKTKNKAETKSGNYSKEEIAYKKERAGKMAGDFYAILPEDKPFEIDEFITEKMSMRRILALLGILEVYGLVKKEGMNTYYKCT